MFGIFALGVAASPEGMNAPAIAIQGAILQMFAHGIGTSGLFYVAGKLEAASGSRDIHAFGGLGSVMPRYVFVFGLLVFSSLGLPFLAGFAAEILIFTGAFALAPWHTVLALLGLLATAVFLLTILQRLFTGPVAPSGSGMADISCREILYIAPLLLLTLWIGVFPSTWLEFSDPFVESLTHLIAP